MPYRYTECGNCGHYRSEHNSDGACICDVLETPVLRPSVWVQCSCTDWEEPDA